MKTSFFTFIFLIGFTILFPAVFYFYNKNEEFELKKNKLSREISVVNSNISKLEKNYAVLSRLDRLAKIVEMVGKENADYDLSPAKPSQIYLFDDLEKFNYLSFSRGLIKQ